MPVLDLAERIQEEVAQNPALEILEDKNKREEQFPDREIEEAAYFDTSSDSGYQHKNSGIDSDSKRMFIEGALSRPESLKEHLLWQLRLQNLSEHTKTLGEILIQNLSNDGFLEKEATKYFPESQKAQVIEVVKLIQSFEPIGTCVTNYLESLLAQVTVLGDDYPFAEAIIRDHLNLVEKEKAKEIAKKLKTDEDEVLATIDFIKTLSPYPGRVFSADEIRFVTPDLLIKSKDGDFVIVLNDEEIPVLGIDPFFSELSGAKTAEKETTSYVKQNIRDAKVFIKSIHQRNETLLKVSRALVEYQRDFFARGPKHLKPLTLNDIAEEIGVHETTVSRIANKKFIQTEWGIFELRYFFTNSVSGSGSSGSHFSKEGVKQIIKEVIETEGEGKKLSDQDITNILAKKGIPIARRTVAKYRNELKMYTSFDR